MLAILHAGPPGQARYTRAAGMRFQPGQVLGRYEIVAALGSGGMGEVYRARDSRLARDVALKFANADAPESAAAISLSEARAASALNHPHLCTLFEVDEADGQAVIVMELVEGELLAAATGPHGLPPATVIRWGAQIAAGVAHAHDRGVVHRDLKSTNIMITRDGRVKVLDFGLARRVDLHAIEVATTVRTPARADALAGTLPSMAPEVLRGGEPTPRSDVWAIGIVLFEMATGRRPFTGSTAFDLTASIIREPLPDPGPGVPPALATVIRRCLEKLPDARYADAGQLAAVLDAIGPDPAPAATRGPVRVTRRFVLAATLAIVAGLALLGWWRPWSAAPAPAIRSLAVLPLSDLSGAARDDYFADGVTDALIGEIGQLDPLRVISRTSAMRYKGSSKSIPEIARELSVDAVLEGSVLRVGPRVRLTAQLVDARTALSLWTTTFEREVGELIGLQRDLARRVATELRVRLTPAQTERLGSAARVAPAAVEAYLLGRYHWNKRTPPSIAESITFFEEAIAQDPSYAAPYAGLAASYVLLGGFGYGAAPASEAFPKAREVALRALTLDPDLPEGHTALAYTLLYLSDLEGSERAFKRAIELNPNDATTRVWYGARLAAEGRFDESIAQAERGRSLDPVSPIITAGVSWMFHLAGRHDSALTWARATLALEPDFIIGGLRLGSALKHRGDLPAAVVELERFVKLSGEGPDLLAQLGQVYARAGRRADAQRIIERLRTLSATRYVPAYDVALVHASLGERDEAFAWLRRAFDERYGPLVFARIDPDLNELRGDPRMADLIRDISAIRPSGAAK